MVSILSFFTKKRPKAAAAESSTRSPSPPLHPKAVSGTASRTTRTKASLKDRRASLDSYGFSRRKSSTPAAAVPVAPPRITIDLPFEIDAARASIDEPTNGALHPRRAVRASMPGMPPSSSISLGLDAVGGTPTLSPAERRVLDSQRYTPDDLRAAWECLGREVRDRGAETVGIMLPRRFENCKDRQRQLSVLFVLARRPELADKFPSVANAYPTPAKDKAQDAWKTRLIQVAKDTENPVDIAEALKAMLRRLAANARPIIDPSVYIRFVQQEHAASYPRNAYATMLLPHLSTEVTGLLDAVLEVCNAIAMHAENNAMNAGRLSHLIGWWLLGKLPDGTIGWDALYDEYKLAGQRAEHLFYARIRWQSTQQKMPRRLVQLILSYPFGESSASSEHLPLPPASTFARRVLHVALGTDAAVPSGTDPVKVLGDAIIARLDPKAESSADQWEVLRTKEGKPVTVEQLLSADSQAFLDEVSSAKGIEFTSPSQQAVPLPEDDGGYHPFARDSDRVVGSTFNDARRRSSSYGDVPRLDFSGSSGTPSPNLETGTDNGSPRKSFTSNLVRFNSSTHLSAASRAPQWDDFASHGFSDSGETGEISLQLTKPVTPKKEIKPVLAAPKKIVKNVAPSTNLVIVNEEVIDVDDGFIHFVEDGQLDPVASSLWPRFALVQLREPIESDAGKVGWLLVTVKKREVRQEEEEPIPDIRSELARPLSPSAESSMSRLSGFGFRDIANTFRRSSLYGGRSHRSTFHSKSSKGEVLSPVKERGAAIGHRASGASDVPTEYTIGETGEIVKIPTALELETIAAGGTPRCSSPVVDGTAKTILATSPAQWVYLAEGGAHVVFRYTGSEPSFQGRALRLQKVAKKGSPDVAVRHAWADKLLPMILPAHLLPESTTVSLDEKWTRALVTPTELLRQSSRRAEGALAQIVDYSRPVQLMDNLTAPIEGETVLALEIKPKWGFLPSATNLTPHESILVKTRNCRFCLHQHYRGDLDEEDGYCPLDLYSGEQPRVRRALDSLWKAWRLSGGEKNNLRVFVNGAKVLPKDARLVPTSGESIPSGTYCLIEPLLTSSNVLATLKKLQANLDPQDISSLAQDFAVEHPDAKLFDPALVPEATISELTEFVMAYKRGDVNWTLRQREIAYALSAIFKDCSIIVRAVLNADTKGYSLNESKSVVKIIDTDLKPLASLGHWAELDDKLWRHWADTKGDEKQNAVARKASIREANSRPSTPVRSQAPTRSPSASPVRPITPVNEAAAAAAILGTAAAGAAGGATLSVATPSSSPVKPIASPVPSIPDMEDANSALARVVDPHPVPDSEILSDDDGEAPPLVKDEAPAPEPEQAEPEVQPVTNTPETREVEPVETAETVPAAIEPEQAAELVTDAKAVEAPVTDEPAPAEPPAPVAAAAILATGPSTIATITAKEDAVVPPAPPPTMETLAVETSLSPGPALSEPIESGAEPEEPEAAADTAPTAKEITKPKSIDLSGVKDIEPAALSPVSVVDPSIDVPAEDRVDFDADPFAKAPVVLASKESRTNLSTIALASPTASAPSGVATPVAAIPSSVGSPADTPSASVVAIPPSSPERTTSRVRDRIKAFENKDTGNKPLAVATSNKPPAMSPRRTSGVSATPKSPERESPKAEKKPTKKNSFVAFVRKASATFDRPDKEEKKKEDKEKATSPVETPKEKERGVNPFGSLRSKKKAAATAGAAAVAATAAVATVGIGKDDKEKKESGVSPEAEAAPEAPATEAVVSAEPSEATPTAEPAADVEVPAEVPATLEPAETLETVTEVSVEGPTPITEDVPPATEDVPSATEDVPPVTEDVAVKTAEDPVAPPSPVAAPPPITDSTEAEAAPVTPVDNVPEAEDLESTPSAEVSGEATPVQSPNPAGLMVAEITGMPADDSPIEVDVPTSESESPGTPTPVGPTFPQVASPSLFRPNSAVSPLMFEQRVSPDPAMPESAVLPKEALPLVAGSAFGLGFGPVNEHAEESDESSSARAGLDLKFDGVESVDEFVTPAVDVDPPTPATPTPTSYFTSETKPGFSAVTPEFAGTSVLASPPSVPSPLRNVPENDETAADTTLVDEEADTVSRSRTASPSPHAAVDAEKPEKRLLSRSASATISRSTSPVPGPPENMEMYQHASLPPLPVNKAGSVEVMEDSPVEAASNSSTEVDPSAFASTTDTPFATAPDTPAYTASESIDEDEAPALDLPELAAFTKRMADRRISANESFYEASSTATSQHPVGYTPLSDNYRTSVHTFGGTQSEAAWLNGIVKSRLSLDDARKLPENGEEATPIGTLTASSTVSEIKALAAAAPEASKDAA